MGLPVMMPQTSPGDDQIYNLKDVYFRGRHKL